MFWLCWIGWAIRITTLPPVIHIAGTNGKGSTLAFLRAGLEAAGNRVHAYTSPHLVRFAERIRIDGQLISDAALQAVLNECEQSETRVRRLLILK